jgi:hypothetical protein
MWIYGNSESIYFTKDDQGEYLGMNKARCSDMFVEFKDNKPTKILFMDRPEGELLPIHMVLFQPNRLDGFRWRIDERPLYPSWVYRHIPAPETSADPFKIRLDSLMNGLEDAEFRIFELLHDPLLEKQVDLPIEEESPAPNALEASNVPPPAHQGKFEHRDRSDSSSNRQTIEAAEEKPRPTTKERLRHVREKIRQSGKNLSTPATKDEIAARNQKKLERMRTRVHAMGKRYEKRHLRKLRRQNRVRHRD